MMHQFCTRGFAAFTAFLILGFLASLNGQEPPEEKKKDARDEAHRLEAEKVIGAIEVEVGTDDKWSKVKRYEKPLLYYGDPTRDNDRGSLWGWGEKGRPVALLELYQNVNDRTKWAYAVCNTSGRKLRASRSGEAWWRANESATELQPVPDAPAAAGEAPQRARQMKLLAQKFTGHQFWDPNNSRFELRRLERPLVTYQDPDAGISDGALYVLANGTNPEIVLFLEARVDPSDKTKTTWQYGVGRLAHAELHLEFDGKEIFDAPRGHKVSAADKPYWLGFLASEAKK